MPAGGAPVGGDAVLEGLSDTSLYSIGAYFCDRHPELVDDVLAQSVDIETVGLRGWAQREGVELTAAFQTLVTGLALRYFRAVAGTADGQRAEPPDPS